MSKKQLILDFCEYDLNHVIADIEEIRRYNLQRYEMEQLTAICHVDTARAICVGYRDLGPDEFWARGHMPGMPLMPGVIMCEAAAQLASYYARKFNLMEGTIGFGGLEEVYFRGVVRPGDRFVIVLRLLKLRRTIMACEFQCFVKQNMVCNGILKGIALPVQELPPAPTPVRDHRMGRRALRKVDPALDLSRHFRTLAELPRPWDPAAWFGRPGPLEVEVGSGKGLFLRTAAAAQPAANFLGLELAGRYARFAAAGLAKRGLANALVVEGDALRAFRELLTDNSLAAVHVYFPDPWWKKRHKKRRVMQAAFLQDAERTLRPGGTLHFWTDVEEYFHSALAVVAAATTLAGPFDVPELPAADDMAYRTHFERRVRKQHESVFRAEFRKKA